MALGGDRSGTIDWDSGMSRRVNDFYETPPWMTRALLDHVPEICGTVLESCAGDNSIAHVLSTEGGLSVITNDIDPARGSDHCACASDLLMLKGIEPDWIVTNPPYQMPLCTQIVEASVEMARVGVAMMLRISFEEPTAKVNPRGPFLERRPLSRKLVMPRHSFTGNGKSDSATTAWMIWAKVPLSGQAMLSLYKADERYAQPWRRAA